MTPIHAWVCYTLYCSSTFWTLRSAGRSLVVRTYVQALYCEQVKSFLSLHRFYCSNCVATITPFPPLNSQMSKHEESTCLGEEGGFDLHSYVIFTQITSFLRSCFQAGKKSWQTGSLFICGAADRSGRGKRCSSCCCYCCLGGDHFSVSHVQFFGVWKGKTLSQKGCEKAKHCLKRGVTMQKNVSKGVWKSKNFVSKRVWKGKHFVSKWLCKGKTLSQNGWAKVKIGLSSCSIDLSKILYITPQISESIPFLFAFAVVCVVRCFLDCFLYCNRRTWEMSGLFEGMRSFRENTFLGSQGVFSYHSLIPGFFWDIHRWLATKVEEAPKECRIQTGFHSTQLQTAMGPCMLL